MSTKDWFEHCTPEQYGKCLLLEIEVHKSFSNYEFIVVRGRQVLGEGRLQVLRHESIMHEPGGPMSWAKFDSVDGAIDAVVNMEAWGFAWR